MSPGRIRGSHSSHHHGRSSCDDHHDGRHSGGGGESNRRQKHSHHSSSNDYYHDGRGLDYDSRGGRHYSRHHQEHHRRSRSSDNHLDHREMEKHSGTSAKHCYDAGGGLHCSEREVDYRYRHASSDDDYRNHERSRERKDDRGHHQDDPNKKSSVYDEYVTGRKILLWGDDKASQKWNSRWLMNHLNDLLLEEDSYHCSSSYKSGGNVLNAFLQNGSGWVVECANSQIAKSLRGQIRKRHHSKWWVYPDAYRKKDNRNIQKSSSSPNSTRSNGRGDKTVHDQETKLPPSNKKVATYDIPKCCTCHRRHTGICWHQPKGQAINTTTNNNSGADDNSMSVGSPPPENMSEVAEQQRTNKENVINNRDRDKIDEHKVLKNNFDDGGSGGGQNREGRQRSTTENKNGHKSNNNRRVSTGVDVQLIEETGYGSNPAQQGVKRIPVREFIAARSKYIEPPCPEEFNPHSKCVWDYPSKETRLAELHSSTSRGVLGGVSTCKCEGICHHPSCKYYNDNQTGPTTSNGKSKSVGLPNTVEESPKKSQIQRQREKKQAAAANAENQLLNPTNKESATSKALASSSSSSNNARSLNANCGVSESAAAGNDTEPSNPASDSSNSQQLDQTSANSDDTSTPTASVQQQMTKEKTLIRKGFVWSWYPELEKFLIDNEPEYFECSNVNSTAVTRDQIQFNKRLTERLLEVASQNNYTFQKAMKFGAIRDRIRAYYKSKRGNKRKYGVELRQKEDNEVSTAFNPEYPPEYPHDREALATVSEHSDVGSKDTCGQEFDALWDPKKADEAEQRGQNIEGFLRGNYELVKKEFLMGLLHKCNYNVDLARSKYSRFVGCSGAEPTSTLDDDKVGKFEKLLQTSTKEFTHLGKAINCRPVNCMIHYYKWKQTSKEYSEKKLEWKRQNEEDQEASADSGHDLQVEEDNTQTSARDQDVDVEEDGGSVVAVSRDSTRAVAATAACGEKDNDTGHIFHRSSPLKRRRRNKNTRRIRHRLLVEESPDRTEHFLRRSIRPRKPPRTDYTAAIYVRPSQSPTPTPTKKPESLELSTLRKRQKKISETRAYKEAKLKVGDIVYARYHVDKCFYWGKIVDCNTFLNKGKRYHIRFHDGDESPSVSLEQLTRGICYVSLIRNGYWTEHLPPNDYLEELCGTLDDTQKSPTQAGDEVDPAPTLMTTAPPCAQQQAPASAQNDSTAAGKKSSSKETSTRTIATHPTLTSAQNHSEIINKKMSFLERLWKVLNKSEHNRDWKTVVSWVDNGASFKVHNRRRFETNILLHHFGRCKDKHRDKGQSYRTFKANLQWYGFEKIGEQHYRHEQFTRANQQQSEQIKRLKRRRSWELRQNSNEGQAEGADARSCPSEQKSQEATCLPYETGMVANPVEDNENTDVGGCENPSINDSLSAEALETYGDCEGKKDCPITLLDGADDDLGDFGDLDTANSAAKTLETVRREATATINSLHEKYRLLFLSHQSQQECIKQWEEHGTSAGAKLAATERRLLEEQSRADDATKELKTKEFQLSEVHKSWQDQVIELEDMKRKLEAKTAELERERAVRESIQQRYCNVTQSLTLQTSELARERQERIRFEELLFQIQRNGS